jgi:ATP-binding protein involved in chromosome partitioning
MPDTNLSAQIKAAFASVDIPGGGKLAEFSGLSEIIVTQSAIAAAISIVPGMEAAFGPARAEAQKLAEGLAGGRKVMISLTADKATAQHAHARQPGPPAKEIVQGVKHIIAIASGKGGVGKSTTAVNIALALLAEGLRVGLLDADLYGPSVPKLLGIEGKPAVRADGIFSPHAAYGLKAISIGSMLTADQAVVWRGPMATAALRQLLRETDWGGLDVLVVDLPPGTGDIR